jgi:hypothetical protein
MSANKTLVIILVTCIILLGALLRLSFLAQIPNGFFCDEAVRGYDAYSLLLTGRDQYGEFLPLFTRSLDDWPESSFVFIMIPFVAILGLTELAVRLPAALLGILTIPALYFLVKEIFGKKTALVAALFLAISPWHIQFSRVGMSSYTLMPLLFSLALLFFIKAVKGRPGFLYLSAVIFSLSLYSYYSARVFVPLFLVGIGIIFFRDLVRMKKQALFFCLIILCVLIPLSFFWLSPKGMARASESIILSVPKNLYYYLSYFNPLFLFINGDTQLVHSIRKVGQLHFFEVITVLAGFIGILLGLKKKECRILLLWAVLYPFPAFLTGGGNASRAIIGTPLFAILSAFGLFTCASLFKSRKGRVVFFTAIFLIASLNFGIYCKRYFIDYPKYGAPYWQYGMKEAILWAENSPYDCVIVSNSLTFAHNFVLFYTKFPPKECHLAMRRGDLSFGKYRIRFVSDKLKIKAPCLLIIEPYEMKKLSKKVPSPKVLHTIKDPNGSEVIKLVEVSS